MEKNERSEAQGDTVRASWNFGMDQFMQNSSHYTTEERETMVAFFRWCNDPQHPMRRDEAARRVGCSPNLLYQLFTGIYRSPDEKDGSGKVVRKGALRGPSVELIGNIKSFLADESRRFALGENKFVLTPTAKKFATSCDLARESNSPVLIWGASHIGKTWAAQHYTQAHNHGRTFYVRLTAASGLFGMINRIASVCGISDKSNCEALVERIKRVLTPNTLLILDECHLLFNTYQKQNADKCFEKLREIYDETDCGMVWIFTILDELKARSQKELQQVWRRGVHKVPLPSMPTKGDLATILKHHGLDFPERDLSVTVKSITEQPYEILRQLAKTEGLKSITERIRYGRKLAGKETKKITWEHFVDAHLRIQKQATAEPDWN